MLRFAMLPAVLLILVTGAAAEYVTPEGETPWYTTIEEAQAAAGEDKLVAVKFYTDW